MQAIFTNPLFKELIIGLIYMGSGSLLLFLAKMLYRLVSPFKLDDELTENDNPALGLSMCGYYIGVAIIFVGVMYDPASQFINLPIKELLTNIVIDMGYATIGVVVMLIGAMLVDKVLLPQFSTTQEIIRDRNMGVGWLQFGSFTASALAVAGAINSSWGGIPATILLYALGQLAILGCGFGYRFLAGYNVAKEIEEDNVAAGGSLAMSLIAIGILVAKVAAADYEGYLDIVIWFVIDTVFSVLILLALRWFTDLVFLPRATYKEEVVRDRNINAPFIEGSLEIAMALIIVFAL